MEAEGLKTRKDDGIYPVKKRNKKKNRSVGLSPEQLKNIGINSDRILKLPTEEEFEADASEDVSDDSLPEEEEIFGITGQNQEAAAAYAAYLKKKAQKTAASVSASAKPQESKLKVQDLPKFEETKPEEPAKVEEPAKPAETKAEEPAKVEETKKQEETAKAEETKAEETKTEETEA